MAGGELDAPRGRTRQLGFGTPTEGPKPAAPDVFIPRAGASVSSVFDTYWRFAAERQKIYFRRLAGCHAPWTDDSILAEHRFTNAYRAADRVSQYLIRNVIYDRDRPFRDTFFRVLLFKFFNRIQSWESLCDEFGEISYESFSLRHFVAHFDRKLEARVPIYSSAYIMPAADRRKGVRKHQSHLELLVRMMKEDLPQRVQNTTTMRAAFDTLSTYPMMGNFLAYQFITDLNYAPDTNFSESEFVVPGPGARDGIRKCFSSLGEWSESDAIRYVAETQTAQFERLGLHFRSLFGRPLQLIDCQNLFCEVDKYARIRHPEIAGLSGRTRIKQRFQPAGPMPAPYFPPKWGLNRRMEAGYA